MRACVQRVEQASVVVDGETVGQIKQGLLVLLGVSHSDTSDDAMYLAEKIVDLRLFADDEGKMNRSLAEAGGAMLVVSQFTLLADARKGRRPSFIGAADPDFARVLIDRLVISLRSQGVVTETGVFGASMSVELVNEGPVTIVLEIKDGRVV